MLNQLINVTLHSKNRINNSVIENFSRLKISFFILPLFILISIALFLYSQESLSVVNYVQIQKKYFYLINAKLSEFPTIVYNLTQVGDALIFLSLLTLFIIYAPKIWEALLSASLVSAVFSGVLKDIFLVPRPAAALDNHTFVIIGKTLPGHSSLPSGHSITVFTILTVLLFAFMPKKWNYKFLWIFLIVSSGLILVFTRVGVGAHYPLDVITGSIIGYISGLIGIFISQKYTIWSWINDKKYFPVFILLFLICSVIVINRIISENLIIYYFTLLSLIISLYKIIYVYIKK